MIGIDLRSFGGTIGVFGYPTLGDARNAGMEAQIRNSEAYRQAHQPPQDPALLQNAYVPSPSAAAFYASFSLARDRIADLRRPDWVFWGWLTAMAGVALIRAGWMLLR